MSTTAYQAPTRLLHWLMAFLIAAMFATAWISEDASREMRGVLMGMHKSFGITVLGLLILRILVRVMSPRVEPAAGPRPQQIAAHAIHGVLYLLMLVVPVIGWLLVSAKGRVVSYFNMVDLPALMAQGSEELGEFLEETHEVGANVLMVLAGLHIAAALYHQFIVKDGLIRRMLP